MKKFLIIAVPLFIIFLALLSNQIGIEYDVSFFSFFMMYLLASVAATLTVCVIFVLTYFINFDEDGKRNKEKKTYNDNEHSKSISMKEDETDKRNLDCNVSPNNTTKIEEGNTKQLGDSKPSSKITVKVSASATTGHSSDGSIRGSSFGNLRYSTKEIAPEPEFRTFGEDYVDEWYQWEERTPEYMKAKVGGHIIIFEVRTHTYLVDGIKVPSVSTLVERECQNPYTNVPNDILRNARNKGIAMHNAVEDYEINGVDDNSSEVNGYKRLKDIYKFKPMATELMVAYFINKRPICAGRIDFLLDEGSGCYGILDLKRTSKYYRDRVEMQLNLYRLCLAQSSRKEVTNLCCLRLREYEWNHHNVDIKEEKAKAVLTKLYIDISNAEFKKKMHQMNSGPEYKVGQHVFYDSKVATVTFVDNEKKIIEVQILRGQRVRTTMKNAKEKGLRHDSSYYYR